MSKVHYEVGLRERDHVLERREASQAAREIGTLAKLFEDAIGPNFRAGHPNSRTDSFHDLE